MRTFLRKADVAAGAANEIRPPRGRLGDRCNGHEDSFNRRMFASGQPDRPRQARCLIEDAIKIAPAL